MGRPAGRFRRRAAEFYDRGRWFGLVALSLIFGLNVHGQEYARRPPDLDRLTQELFAEIQSDQMPYEDLYEMLLQYYQTPLNLNTATREELRSLQIGRAHV